MRSVEPGEVCKAERLLDISKGLNIVSVCVMVLGGVVLVMSGANVSLVGSIVGLGLIKSFR
jgi:hypothetical protein